MFSLNFIGPQSQSNKENLFNGARQTTDSIQQHYEKPSQSNFMQTMSQNALTNALKSINSNTLNTESRTSNILNEDSSNSASYEENPIDENEEDAQTQTTDKGGGLDNWYLSGLQTVKFMSPSDCENLTEVENDDDVISDQEESSCHGNQEEFSDLDDVGLQYESEDGVRPFSTDISEDEHETLLRRSQNSDPYNEDPFQRYLNMNSSQTQRQLPQVNLGPPQTTSVKYHSEGDPYCQQRLPNRENSALLHKESHFSENEAESNSDDEENECTVIHNEENAGDEVMVSCCCCRLLLSSIPFQNKMMLFIKYRIKIIPKFRPIKRLCFVSERLISITRANVDLERPWDIFKGRKSI